MSAREPRFHRVAAAADIPPGKIRTFDAGGEAVAVANVGGTFHAVNDLCPHAGGSLGSGRLHGSVVTCPMHSWPFDLVKGECTFNPHVAVRTYPVKLEGGEVFVAV